MNMNPRILALGTAVPETSYTQEELVRLFGAGNPKITRLFLSSHIRKRHLTMPTPGPLGMPEESVEELLAKHRTGILREGGRAVEQALQQAAVAPEQIDYLVCVTSTGYLCPGATALLIDQHGFRQDIHRIDVVGMGCNAALNGLQPLVQFLRYRPEGLGMLVCIETCSAAYVNNDQIGTAVVNSLFGDAAAAALLAGPKAAVSGNDVGLPVLEDFESQIILEALHTMRFDLDHGKLSFFLDRDIPYFLGANCQKPVARLLERQGLKKRQIDHWLVHSGGRKVIDSIKMNLDLSDHDVRHTLNILEEYGNISSCSVLFSMRELAREGTVRPGDRGILMAMGPGAAIELALLRW